MLTIEEITCPVCGASGNRSETCRRCRADLDELQRLRIESNRSLRRAFFLVSKRDFSSALHELRNAASLRPAPELRRLAAALEVMKSGIVLPPE